MRVRKLTVKNYRGIKKATWDLDGSFFALLGPGDSTKTTLLDALGLVLSTRYALTFTDADFYKCDTTEPIVIEAVVVDLPNELIEERSHGKNRSGIRDDGSLEHDPLEEEGVSECLVIRLTVDESLEPIWEIVRPGDTEGDRASASERAHLGFFRIGDYVDMHLKWGRGSALSAMTTSKTHATSAVVEAQRSARGAINDLTGTPLHEAATMAQVAVKRLGSGPFKALRPGLDPHLAAATSALVLQDDNVPLTQFGLGSRRLISIAIQENALAGKSIVAIDELEDGLDPHRLLHLVRYLRARADAGELQVIFTTHSPLVVETLSHSEVFIVRSNGGTTSVTGAPSILGGPEVDTLQGVIRERPSALLALRVLVGEGATEVGFMRQLFYQIDKQVIADGELTSLTSVTAGIAVSNGAGSSQAPVRALALANLGYPTALLIDGDVTDNKVSIQAAKDAGVAVVQWPTGKALEDVIVDELPVAALQQLVDFAVDERSEEAIASSVNSRHPSGDLSGVDVTGWIASSTETKVRQAIGLAAKGSKSDGGKDESKSWFKREDRGEQLGAIIYQHIESLKGGILTQAIETLKSFAYVDPNSADVQPEPDE